MDGAQLYNGEHPDVSAGKPGLNFVFGWPLVRNKDDWELRQDKIIAGHPPRHLLTVAPTRAGKGVSLIIPNLLTYTNSVIVIDPKGENAWLTAAHRQDRLKHNVIVVDPWGEVQRRYGDAAETEVKTSRYNPLAFLHPGDPNYADDLGYIADALIIDQGKDPHWPDSARELVAGLIAFVVEKPELRPLASLGLVRQLLCGTSAEIQTMAEDAKTLGEDSVAARKLGRFAGDGGRETDSILSTARTQTAFLDSVTLQKSMEASDFEFENLLAVKTTIYLVLPVDKLQTYGRWLRLLISIAIRAVVRDLDKDYAAVLFILDEFGTIGRLNAVSQAYGLMAGMGMKLWAFVQDLHQLKRDYPDEWETFIANSSEVIVFGAMDQFTCEYFSKMAGDKEVKRASGETVFQPLVRPDEFRRMASHQCAIFGMHDPKYAQLLSYYGDKLFAGLARPFGRKKAVPDAAALKALDDPEAARAALELYGYKIKSTWLGGYTVIAPGSAEKQVLKTDGDLTRYAKKELAGKPIPTKG